MRKSYVEFLMGPSSLSIKKQSYWEYRDAGLLKIMTRVFENLQEADIIKQKYTIRINTHDFPTKSNISSVNYIEFDTSTKSLDESNIFPDFVFGNWWHIGLRNFDKFCEEICSNNQREKIKDKRIFWIGALQGIKQRIDYLNLCEKNPDKLCGNEVFWKENGIRPDKFVHIKDKCHFKYLIDLTGIGFSGRLKLLPFCNRPLFIADRKLWTWSDILILKQNLHIIVKEDLSDLIDQYEWAEKNQDVCVENCEKLLDFCKSNFTFNKICERATQLVANAILGDGDCYEFWGGENGKEYYGKITLDPDGSISLYNHFNESFWYFEDDLLIILNKNKKPTSILKKEKEGVYVGSFIDNPKIIHKLIKIEKFAT